MAERFRIEALYDLQSAENQIAELTARIRELEQERDRMRDVAIGRQNRVLELRSERDELREALEVCRAALSGDHRTAGEACGVDACALCWAQASVEALPALSPEDPQQ